RGAVPVVLAIVPVVMGVPDSQLLFNVAFAVVLLSLLVQGATVPLAARWLGVEVPPRDEPRDKREVWVGEAAAVDMLEFCVAAGAKADGRHPDELGTDHPGHDVRCVALVREGSLHRLTPDTRLRPGDSVWMIAPDEISEQLARTFAGSRGELTANASFFGEFVVDPDSRASDLADAYGLRIAEAERELAMGELLAVRLGRPPVVGDRVDIGAFALTVREMGDKGRITALGLKCPPFGGGR
ncbi:MAG TPA: transporter associated domain-containing protein, partial [Thauera aminoaromatica]|nr:transporter associated domain-containing protein [Thauera aminoaromatica]